MDVTVLNATFENVVALVVNGRDVTGGNGLAAMSSATDAMRTGMSGVTVQGFTFGTEIEIRFADGSGWNQYINDYGGSAAPPLLNLFCFANGYVLSLPDGTIQSIFYQRS
ncbi:MAG TPA: hypothetical protein VGB24_18555 [Longimicrobium sp.]|uniref:hypothetical protein n=1 Tax=Longimicrobium sp. TaxID=2029185 RepID=UPI002EDB860C